MDLSARTYIPLIELNLEKGGECDIYNMKFLHLSRRESTEKNCIRQYTRKKDIKDIVRRALDSEENYNLLFVGQPASAKTLFLEGISELRRGVYFDGSNTTSRILDVLEVKRPKIICIDELEKMSRQFQFLNFLVDVSRSICRKSNTTSL
jgi:hypothetical protein